MAATSTRPCCHLYLAFIPSPQTSCYMFQSLPLPHRAACPRPQASQASLSSVEEHKPCFQFISCPTSLAFSPMSHRVLSLWLLNTTGRVPCWKCSVLEELGIFTYIQELSRGQAKSIQEIHLHVMCVLYTTRIQHLSFLESYIWTVADPTK